VHETGPNVTSWVESGLSENTAYTRHCHAYNFLPGSVRNYSHPSNTVVKYTRVLDPGAADLALQDIGNGNVSIAATPPPNPTAGMTSVYIERDDNSSFSSPYVVSAWSKTYTQIDTVPINDTWYYRIKFRNGDGLQTSTHWESIEVVSIPPAAPSGFVGDSMTDSSITWHWTDNVGTTDEDGFEIQDSSNTQVIDAAANETQVTESGLDENTYYTRHCHSYNLITISNENYDFEAGEQGWTIDCSSTTVKWYRTTTHPHVGSYCFAYNDGVDYDDGAQNFGSLKSPAINLTGATNPQLTFWCYYQTEDSGTSWDRRYVQIYEGVTQLLNQQLSGEAMQSWHSHAIDLSAYVGKTIEVRFFFDSIDSVSNDYEGWFIDDVYVSGLPEGPTRNYSTASNSDTKCTLVHDPTASDFTLTHLGNGQVQVVVTPPLNQTIDSTGVYIERDEDGANWLNAVLVGGGWTNTYTHTDNVSTGSTWYYRITFRNAVGTATAVSPVKTITPTVPATPTNFGGTAASTTSITWHWTDNATDEDGFEVQDSSDTMMAEIAVVDATSVIETGLSENTAYIRHCHAYNVLVAVRNYSSPSGDASEYTKVHDPGDADLALSDTGTNGQVLITVTAPPNSTAGVTGVYIDRDDNAGFTSPTMIASSSAMAATRKPRRTTSRLTWSAFLLRRQATSRLPAPQTPQSRGSGLTTQLMNMVSRCRMTQTP
jgi:titin